MFPPTEFNPLLHRHHAAAMPVSQGCALLINPVDRRIRSTNKDLMTRPTVRTLLEDQRFGIRSRSPPADCNCKPEYQRNNESDDPKDRQCRLSWGRSEAPLAQFCGT